MYKQLNSSKNNQIPQLLSQQSNNSYVIVVNNKNNNNNINIYGEHIYSLFLLLFYHGEIKHCQLIAQKAQECRDLYLLHVSGQNQQDKNNKKIKQALILVQSLNFLRQELKRTDKFAKNSKNSDKVNSYYHTGEQKMKIRRAITAIYELENGQINKDQELSIQRFSKMAASLIRIKCNLRDFQQFTLIQFTCSLYKKNNIEVFIQINKQKQTYKYVKQYLQIPQPNMKFPQLIKTGTQFSTDSFVELPYIKFRCLESKYQEIVEDGESQGDDADEYSYTESHALISQKSRDKLSVNENNFHIQGDQQQTMNHNSDNIKKIQQINTSPIKTQQNYLLPALNFPKHPKILRHISNNSQSPITNKIPSKTPEPQPEHAIIFPFSQQIFKNSISNSLYKINVTKMNNITSNNNNINNIVNNSINSNINNVNNHYHNLVTLSNSQNIHYNNTDDCCCDYRGIQQQNKSKIINDNNNNNDKDEDNDNYSNNQNNSQDNFDNVMIFDKKVLSKSQIFQNDADLCVGNVDDDLWDDWEHNQHQYQRKEHTKIQNVIQNSLQRGKLNVFQLENNLNLSKKLQSNNSNNIKINDDKILQKQQQPIVNLFKSIFSHNYVPQNKQKQQINNKNTDNLNNISHQKQQNFNNFIFETNSQTINTKKNSIYLNQLTNLAKIQSDKSTNQKILQNQQKLNNNNNNIISNNNTKVSDTKTQKQTKITLTSSTTIDTEFQTKLKLRKLISHGYQAPEYIKYQSPIRSKYNNLKNNNNTNINININTTDMTNTTNTTMMTAMKTIKLLQSLPVQIQSDRNNSNNDRSIGKNDRSIYSNSVNYSKYTKNQHVLDRYRHF